MYLNVFKYILNVYLNVYTRLMGVEKLKGHACDMYIEKIKNKLTENGQDPEQLIEYKQQVMMPAEYRSEKQNIKKYDGKLGAGTIEIKVGLLAWFKKENHDEVTFCTHIHKDNAQLYAENDQYIKRFDYVYLYEFIENIDIDFGIIDHFKDDIPKQTDDDDEKELHCATMRGYFPLGWIKGNRFKLRDIKEDTKYDGRIHLEGIINVY